MEDCLSVTQVNTLAKQVLEEYSVWIKGEVSGCSPDKYYYKYFKLKDELSAIDCVFPASKLLGLGFSIEDGITIKAFGKLSIFERDGRFQFKVEILEKDGVGDLQARIEEIKQRLQKEGLLDEARKRKLPLIPKKIGVITSKDSAAWKDFFKILQERYPNVEILLYDVLVQGDKSAKDVIKAMKYLNTIDDLDFIVITRGGGSLEDLMAFNDEQLAREAAQSRHPIVSAIGHEKDISVLDLVADLRASTPSNAAELIAPHKDALYQGLDVVLSRMQTWANNRIAVCNLNMSNTIARSDIVDVHRFTKRFLDELLSLSGKMASNKRIYESYGYQLSEIQYKFQSYSKNLVPQYITSLVDTKEKFRCASEDLIQEYTHILEKIGTHIELRNPLQILEKGYSIVKDSQGNIIKSVKSLKKGSELETQFSDGSVKSNILDITIS